MKEDNNFRQARANAYGDTGHGTDDTQRLVEQAMSLSRLFGKGDQANDNAQMVNQMMDMYKALRSFQSDITKPTESVSETVFDDEINTPAIKSIKAAIPYLEPRYQKNVGLMIKLIEIQRLIEVYSNRAVALNDGVNWKRGMLTAIRPHVVGEKQALIDKLIKVMDMKELIEAQQKSKEATREH